METVWHYRNGNEDGGPVSTEELRDLIASGRLPAASFVRSEADSTWRPAGVCEELREAFTKPLPPYSPPTLPPPLPVRPKPIWPWVAGAVAVLALPVLVVMLIALLGNTERSSAVESIPSEVVAGSSPVAEEQSTTPPLTISGEDATEELIRMMAEMTAEQRTAIGLHYLTTGEDFYGARIRITNRSDSAIWVRPENVRLHLQGDTVGVSSSRDPRFLRTTLLEPRRYVEGLVVYRAHREAGAAMRLGSGRISYLLE